MFATLQRIETILQSAINVSPLVGIMNPVRIRIVVLFTGGIRPQQPHDFAFTDIKTDIVYG